MNVVRVTNKAWLPGKLPIDGIIRRTALSNSGQAIVVPDFRDGKTAYEMKTTGTLLRSLLVLRLCSVDMLVDNHKKLTTWGQRILTPWLFSKLMKSTFYGHFVAGEDLTTVLPLRERYRNLGIRSILDYSVEEDLPEETIRKSMGGNAEEDSFIDVDSDMRRFKGYAQFADRRSPTPSARSYFYAGEEKCDENLQVFLRCIDASVSEEGNGIACVKVTALGETEVLRHVSSKIHYLLKKQGHYHNMQETLSDRERGQVERIVSRMKQMSEHAVGCGVRVMYDAEQTYFQPAIRWLVLQQMQRYNKTKPVIYSTYQCYLKDSGKMVAEDMALADEQGFHFAAKLVRGAYMDQERDRAMEISYPDPIHPTYKDTEISYHTTLESMLRVAKTGQCSLIVASHNKRTVNFVLSCMSKLGIERENPAVCFAQLLGMSDHISYLLGKHGYSVYKYMPYGPVFDVLPYLGRRAVENRSISKGSEEERQLMWAEVKRRLLKRP